MNSPSPSKAELLADIEGYSSPHALMEVYITDSVCPGICTNENCDYTTEVEPDSSTGWCEECETQSVTSIMVLEGVI